MVKTCGFSIFSHKHVKENQIKYTTASQNSTLTCLSKFPETTNITTIVLRCINKQSYLKLDSKCIKRYHGTVEYLVFC